MILSIRSIMKPKVHHSCAMCQKKVEEKAIRVSGILFGKIRMEYYHALCYKLHRQGYTEENIQP